jgi:hypothetical protein
LTNDERDRAISALIQICLSLREKVNDAQYQILALRLAAQKLLPATEEQLDAIVAACRETVQKGVRELDSAREDEALRTWLARMKGPTQ